MSNRTEKNSLGVNPEQTKLLLFTRDTGSESSKLQTLELSREAKYLGLNSHPGFSWKMIEDERMKEGINTMEENVWKGIGALNKKLYTG